MLTVIDIPSWFREQSIYTPADIRDYHTSIQLSKHGLPGDCLSSQPASIKVNREDKPSTVDGEAVPAPVTARSPCETKHEIENERNVPVSDLAESQANKESSKQCYPKEPLEVAQDVFDELQDLTRASLSSICNKSPPMTPPSIVIVTKQENNDYVVRQLVIELAKSHSAGVVTFNLEDFRDVTADAEKRLKTADSNADGPGANASKEADDMTPKPVPDPVTVKLLDQDSKALEATSKTVTSDESPATPAVIDQECSVNEPATKTGDEDCLSTIASERRGSTASTSTSVSVKLSPESSASPIQPEDLGQTAQEDEASRHQASGNACDEDDKVISDEKLDLSADLDSAGDEETIRNTTKHDTEEEDDSDDYMLLDGVEDNEDDDKDSTDDEGRPDDDKIIGCILQGGLAPQGPTEQEKNPLFVLWEDILALKPERNRSIARSLIKQIQKLRDAGYPTILFVSASEKSLTQVGTSSCSCCLDNTLMSALKADTTSTVRLDEAKPYPQDVFARLRAFVQRLCRELRQQYPDKVGDKLLPTPDQLQSLHQPALKFDLGDDNRDKLVRQLAGRASQQTLLTFADVKDVMERLSRRHAASKVASASSKGGASDLIGSKVDASSISETFEDIVIDPKTLQNIKQLLTVMLLPLDMAKSKTLKRLAVHGIILHGPPGTGKTQLVRAIAGSMRVSMLSIRPSDILDKYVGESESRIREVFRLAQEQYPCILFIDEADSMLYRRQSGDKSWERSMLNQFLMEMDGLVTSKNKPLVIVATNRSEDIDPAFLRRLPHHVQFELPDRTARAKILKLHLRDVECENDVDLDVLASKTAGFSGSDLRDLTERVIVKELVEKHGDSDLVGQVRGLDESNVRPRMSQFAEVMSELQASKPQPARSSQHAYQSAAWPTDYSRAAGPHTPQGGSRALLMR